MIVLGISKLANCKLLYFYLLIAQIIAVIQGGALKDVLTLNTEPVQRVARDNKYYLSRYGSGSEEVVGSRILKPEESAEAREGEPGALEKRCINCDDRYGGYDRYDRYDSRSRYYDDRYDMRRSRYPEYDYDRYDRYDKYDRYDRYDGRYDRDRYEPRDRYDRDRYAERGIGYDNRGYDYRGTDRGGYDRGSYDRGGYDARGFDRGTYDRGGYRGYDDTSRSYDRGYGGYGGYGSGYASSWNYGGRMDDYNRGYAGNKKFETPTPAMDSYGSGVYRTRDPYNYDNGYQGTSYLYGRPPAPTTTTSRPSSQSDNNVTDNPQQTKSTSG